MAGKHCNELLFSCTYIGESRFGDLIIWFGQVCFTSISEGDLELDRRGSILEMLCTNHVSTALPLIDKKHRYASISSEV